MWWKLVSESRFSIKSQTFPRHLRSDYFYVHILYWWILRKEGLSFAPNLKLQPKPIMVGKAWWQEQLTAVAMGHFSYLEQWVAEVKECSYPDGFLLPSFLLYQWLQPKRWWQPHWGWVFQVLLIISRNVLIIIPEDRPSECPLSVS